MRLRYIELFHAVMTTNSLTGAANLLNISQPAASKALQQAEHQLGFTLFHRVRGRLHPTEQALLLRPRVEKIIRDLHDLQRLTANFARPESEPLRVTCTPTLAQSLVPDATTLLRKAWPAATAELSTRHSAEMCESLTLRETDIGLTLQDASHPELRQEPLCQGRVMVIAPPGRWSPAELAQPLPVTALAGEPMISVWVQTYQLACALVAQGAGLALVDPFTASQGDGDVVQTRPLALELDVVLYAVYRLDSQLNPLQEHFIELVRQLARQTLAPG